jgi:hypothetical protein
MSPRRADLREVEEWEAHMGRISAAQHQRYLEMQGPLRSVTVSYFSHVFDHKTQERVRRLKRILEVKVPVLCLVVPHHHETPSVPVDHGTYTVQSFYSWQTVVRAFCGPREIKWTDTTYHVPVDYKPVKGKKRHEDDW